MDIQPRIRLNVCKSWSCPNLGVADAEDYLSPVYRLGYSALLCKKCGALPPLFNEPEFNNWYGRFLSHKLHLSGRGCPHCYSTDFIGYGYTRVGHQRLQCRSCRAVFTPWQSKASQLQKLISLRRRLGEGYHPGHIEYYRQLEQAVALSEQQLCVDRSLVKAIATQTFVLPFRGQTQNQQLYIVLSADAETGRILQITTNYCDWLADASLHYLNHLRQHPASANLSIPDMVREKEASFMLRSQFDEIPYGSALLKDNDRGCVRRSQCMVTSNA